jgi:hypothetical protein
VGVLTFSGFYLHRHLYIHGLRHSAGLSNLDCRHLAIIVTIINDTTKLGRAKLLVKKPVSLVVFLAFSLELGLGRSACSYLCL